MKIKINSRYKLSQIKLNYNCPKDEKSGEGPGSCSDDKENNKILGGDFGNPIKTREKINSPEYKTILDKINIKNMDQKTKDIFRGYAEYGYADQRRVYRQL